MSYRMRRKSYRGSPGTNFVRQRYQYFVDMQTKSTTMQVINITSGGLMPQIRLRPFFAAFKYFKLGKVKIRFVPAATLPVDPTGLSYEAGEQTVDPRDQMNPGLVRITNGEDVSQLSSILTGVDAERAYYSTMLDPRWYKFQLQSGFKRTAKPLLWNVGQTHQSIAQSFALKTMNAQGVPVPSLNSYVEQTEMYGSSATVSEVTASNAEEDTLESVLMQTGRVRMGWMPTDMFNQGQYGPNAVPEVNLITVILPKAYKTTYFYRVYIEEEIMFKDAVSTFPIVHTMTGSGESMQNLDLLNIGSIDRFVLPGTPVFTGGGTSTGALITDATNKLNGGGL